MLRNVKTYIQKIGKISHLLKSSSPFLNTGFCCIDISDDTFSLAHIIKTKGAPCQLLLCKTYSYEKNKLDTALSEVIKQYHLHHVECSWMLRSTQYQLFPMDALPVPPSEFQEAVRWKLKDLISFPLEDIAVDHFPMPLKSLPGAHAMISTVVARTSYLQPIISSIFNSGLNLTTIDIPELGLRNLTALLEKDEKSIAFVYLQEKNIQLFITRQKTLYFTRTLDFGLESIDDQVSIHSLLDRLALEIQRSFDYYQSQWRQPVPVRVILSLATIMNTSISDYLSQRLTISTEAFHLNSIINMQEKMDAIQQNKYLPILGGILRHEVSSHDAAN